jgi:hypothetical protein
MDGVDQWKIPMFEGRIFNEWKGYDGKMINGNIMRDCCCFFLPGEMTPGNPVNPNIIHEEKDGFSSFDFARFGWPRFNVDSLGMVPRV